MDLVKMVTQLRNLHLPFTTASVKVKQNATEILMRSLHEVMLLNHMQNNMLVKIWL